MRQFFSHCLGLFTILFVVAGSFVTSVTAEEYHFTSIEGLLEQEIGRLILPEVYSRLGLTITITPMPGKRAEKEVTSGRMDGEVMRIWSYGEENTTTIRVPTPYYQLETRAFIKRVSTIEVNTKEELANYSLVKVRGVKHTNNITKGLANVQDVENTAQLMGFLRAGRAEIALTNTADGQYELQKTGATDIVAMPAPLAVLDLYHYLHVDHKDLVGRVDAVIKDMIDSGEMKSLVQQAELTVKGHR
ncbi:substrate-binding periplasmic protein [Desulforhopalus sp. 52FAK]